MLTMNQAGTFNIAFAMVTGKLKSAVMTEYSIREKITVLGTWWGCLF